MQTLKLENPESGLVSQSIGISEAVYAQLSGECPILMKDGTYYTYHDADDDSITYIATRVFIASGDGSISELGWSSNIIK
jgi:hypothetical protein